MPKMRNKKNIPIEQNEAILSAIKVMGSQAKLATAIGVTQPTIFNYLYRKCPIEKAIQIEILTGVKREAIRPDVFKQ